MQGKGAVIPGGQIKSRLPDWKAALFYVSYKLVESILQTEQDMPSLICIGVILIECICRICIVHLVETEGRLTCIILSCIFQRRNYVDIVTCLVARELLNTPLGVQHVQYVLEAVAQLEGVLSLANHESEVLRQTEIQHVNPRRTTCIRSVSP